MSAHDNAGILGSLRRIILLILVFGLVGTGSELLFIGHDEGALQVIPLVLIASGLGAVWWHATFGTSSSLRVLRVIMGAFISVGLLGVGLHYRGSMEFQLEVDPSLAGTALFMKVMNSKTPPALAPGIMMQLGLLGLAYTYRHTAFIERNKRR